MTGTGKVVHNRILLCKNQRYTSPMARPPGDPFDLKQKVNFYVSVSMIACFGFLMTITVIQALNKDAPILQVVSSPIDLNYDYDHY